VGVEQLADGVFAVEARFEDVPLEVYVIVADRVTVIDPGTSGVPEAKLAPGLAELGLKLRDVDLVINTHGHHDHRGGNAVLRKANVDVKVAAHEADEAWISDTATYLDEQYLRYSPTWRPPAGFIERITKLCGDDGPVDEVLHDGDEISLGRGHTLVVKHVPAHTPGSVVFVHPQGRVLFTGDALQSRGTPLWRRPGFFPCYSSVREYKASLDFFEQCGAEVIGTAHDGVCKPHRAAQLVADSRTLVDEFSAFLCEYLSEVRQATLAEAADALIDHWPRYSGGAQLLLTAGAHLDSLVEDGLAARATGGDNGYVWTGNS
jgi:glyoxylase-like metal-dependent hydrolase (beta-lactamase superfamily II)